MEVSTDPLTKAVDYRVNHDCSNCGITNIDISVGDIFVEGGDEYKYKCGFCSTSNRLYGVPQYVQYTVRQNKVESNSFSYLPKSMKFWKYNPSLLLVAVTVILVLNCLTAIKEGDKYLASALLVVSNLVAVSTGIALILDTEK